MIHQLLKFRGKIIKTKVQESKCNYGHSLRANSVNEKKKKKKRFNSCSLSIQAGKKTHKSSIFNSG